MIIMINGTFGAGKSSVATGLCAALPNAMIYDPEVMGMALRYLTEGVRTPEEETGDFQDIGLWPEMTVLMAERLYRQYGRTLIVPMTLANPRYLDTIRPGLAAVAPPLYHFCLVASLDTIEQRLRSRDQDTSWTMGKARQYVHMFNDPAYAVHVNTENRTVPEIVAQLQGYIASSAPVAR
jgi:chloramphenicol 3-O-phosphotransferase